MISNLIEIIDIFMMISEEYRKVKTEKKLKMK